MRLSVSIVISAMTPAARQALNTIWRCVKAERIILLRHSAERMEERDVFWSDVLAMIDKPADVRDDGFDDWARPRCIITGEAAGGSPLDMVCVIGRNEKGQVTVFVTLYWED